MVRRPPCLRYEMYGYFSERSTVVRGLCYRLFLAALSLWLLLGLEDDDPTKPQHSGEHPFMRLLPLFLLPSLAGSTLLLGKKGCCGEGESEKARVMIKKDEF